MAARKKKSLVIVESPAKAKTINKYLGAEFEVAASKGHVRDLPKSKFGIDIEAGWVPTYVSLKDRKDVITDLKKRAAKAGTVYLAPDPDREGEAIAWHLKEALELDEGRVQRVRFNEITKRAIQDAFSHAGEIDMNRVRAQEARRFLDRVVGYQLSPLLSRKLAQHLSAGRVQSVAVRLIVDREREIAAFKPEEYWEITATVRPKDFVDDKSKAKTTSAKARGKAKPADAAVGEAGSAGEGEKPPLPQGAFEAQLAEWKGQKFAVNNGEEAQAIVASLKAADFIVAKVEQKDRQERPQPPFTTSTLQQQASLRLRFAAKRTMMIAQRLYEGVELGGEGSVALITYMRTDSVRVSQDAQAECRKLIKAKFGDPYLPEKPNVYASGKAAQEGHEAIRPTDLAYTPERVAAFLPQDQLRLYTLIYNRFVASQMSPAVFAVTNVEIQAGEGLFKATGKIMKFDGYRRVYAPASKQEDAILPPLTEKQPLDLLDLVPSQHFTQPPPRYNEASLVKTLEKEGIGRPSTYATIISKIQERGYVEQKERRFYATEIGMTVTDILVEHFPKVMDLKFTSHVEEELDEIEESKIDRDVVLSEFYEPFRQALTIAETKIQTGKDVCPVCGKNLVEKRSKAGIFYGCAGYPDCNYIKKADGTEKREPPKPTEFTCPDCGKPLVERVGKLGPFLACTGYPECKMTMNLGPDGTPVPTTVKTEHKCDKCGSPMVIRQGRRGPFLACSAYPKCKFALDVDSEGNPIRPVETGVACDKCGGPMIVRRGPRGPFLGCAAYPKCRNAKPIPAELKDKLAQYAPPARPKAPAIEVDEPCPQCGSPMKLRPGRRGHFLGCSKYPKCKGTKEASPELLERVQRAAAEQAEPAA